MTTKTHLETKWKAVKTETTLKLQTILTEPQGNIKIRKHERE